MNSPEEPGAYRGPVRRVRIAVAGDTWRIVGQVRVDRMTIPTRPRPGRRITDSASFVEVIVPDDRPLGRLRLVAHGTEVRAAHRDAPGGVPLDDPEAPETGG